MTFFATNLVGQEQWARRGEDEARIRALETKLALVDTGAWTPFTPTLTQNAVAVAKTVNYARYARIGRSIFCVVSMTATGAGTANTDLAFGLPVAAASAGGGRPIGVGYIYKASNFATYPSIATWDNNNGVARMISTMANGIQTQGSASAAYNFAVASGDEFNYQVTYEAAS
jgi:hypothetical protein